MTIEAVNRRIVRERALLEQARLNDLSSLLRETIVSERLGPGVTTALLQLLHQQHASFSTLLGEDGEPTWTGLRERIRTGDRVLSECLAVVAGAFARPIPPIDAACAEAEALTTELYALTRIAADHSVIPADAECVSPASSVVRRRFPDHGIWDIPLIAHEFGHLVARDLLDVDPVSGDTNRPLAELLAGRKRQMAELASDVFAVYVLGAAYVLTLVLHRMDPTARAVSNDDATHPGDASRVSAALYVLGLLGASDIPARRKQYDFLITALTEWWAEAQATAPSDARLDEMAAARVHADAEKVWHRLTSSKLAEGQYLSFPRARAMADDLRKERTVSRPEASCRDVLNAVWLVRFRAWRDDIDIPDRVVAQARRQLLDIKRAHE